MYDNKRGAIGQTITLVIGTIIIFFVLLIFYFIVGELAAQRGITTESKGIVALADFQKEDFDFSVLAMAHGFELSLDGRYKDKIEWINNCLKKLGWDYEAGISQNKLYIVRK